MLENYAESFDKYSKNERKLNRLRSQKSALKHRLKSKENTKRKARTRTLIQIGGLVDLTPLLSICNIELGDDLQIDHPDKAATLLGMLASCSNRLPENISYCELQKFKENGVKLLQSKIASAKSQIT